jgi:hypothetical protein
MTAIGAFRIVVKLRLYLIGTLGLRLMPGAGWCRLRRLWLFAWRLSHRFGTGLVLAGRKAATAAVAAATRAASIAASFAALTGRTAGAAILAGFAALCALAGIGRRRRLSHHGDRQAHQLLDGHDRF